MTKEQLRADPFELCNISIRLYRVQRDLIDRAVERISAKKGNPDYSLSDYTREVLTLQAAIDTETEPPIVPDITRGRGGSLIMQAAAKLGMTREEFEQAAIRNAAAQALGANVLDNRPAPGSGMRPGVRPGSYSAQPEHRTHGRQR